MEIKIKIPLANENDGNTHANIFSVFLQNHFPN